MSESVEDLIDEIDRLLGIKPNHQVPPKYLEELCANTGWRLSDVVEVIRELTKKEIRLILPLSDVSKNALLETMKDPLFRRSMNRLDILDVLTMTAENISHAQEA